MAARSKQLSRRQFGKWILRNGVLVPFAAAPLVRAPFIRAASPVVQTPTMGVTVPPAGGPTFRGASSMAVDGSSGGGWSINIALPSGYQANDILLCMLATHHLTPTFSISGYTSITTGNFDGGTDIGAQWYYRRAVGPPTDANPVGASITANGVGIFFGVIVAYSGCVTSGTPYEDATTNGGESSTVINSATVTAAGNNRRGVCMMAVSNDVVTSNYPPSGWTSRVNATSASGADGAAIIAEANSLIANGNDLTQVDLADFDVSASFANLTLLLLPQ